MGSTRVGHPLALAALALAFGACARPTVVLVYVEGPGVAPVDALAVTVTNGGETEPLQITASGAVSIPTSFALRFRTPVAGPVEVCIETVDDLEPVASGCATGEVRIAETTTLTVTLRLPVYATARPVPFPFTGLEAAGEITVLGGITGSGDVAVVDDGLERTEWMCSGDSTVCISGGIVP